MEQNHLFNHIINKQDNIHKSEALQIKWLEKQKKTITKYQRM